MNLLPEDSIKRPDAMREMPALIKGYLRLNGYVGDGAFIDREFNTVDVCLGDGDRPDRGAVSFILRQETRRGTGPRAGLMLTTGANCAADRRSGRTSSSR